MCRKLCRKCSDALVIVPELCTELCRNIWGPWGIVPVAKHGLIIVHGIVHENCAGTSKLCRQLKPRTAAYHLQSYLRSLLDGKPQAARTPEYNKRPGLESFRANVGKLSGPVWRASVQMPGSSPKHPGIAPNVLPPHT